MGRAARGQQRLPCSCQDSLDAVETLLQKHKVLEQGLEAQAKKISALAAAARSLHEGGHPEAQGALGRCQAMLLRYVRLWAVGGRAKLTSLFQGLRSMPRPRLSCPAQRVATQGR